MNVIDYGKLHKRDFLTRIVVVTIGHASPELCDALRKEYGMSETPSNNRVTLESIHWREVFPFTHLFRAFRLAIQPNKLILALVAVLICYIGGRFLDLLSGKQVVVEQPFYTLRAPADEIQKFISSPTMVEFYRWRDQAKAKNEQMLKGALVEYLKEPQRADELIRSDEAMDNLASALRKEQLAASDALEKHAADTKKIIRTEYENAAKTAKEKDTLNKEYDLNRQQLDQAYDYLQLAIWKSSRIAGLAITLTPQQALSTVIRSGKTPKEVLATQKDRSQIQSTITMADTYDRVKASQGLGIFQASLSYGILMFNSAVDSVLAAKLFFNEDFKDFDATPEQPPGLVRTLALTIQGLGWFVRVHWLYFIIYTLFSLAVWALAGGAICRIAALHATRDEKIPLREAYTFATRKFASFFTAPLMPVLFILGCCVPLLVIGLIGALPFAELLVGLGFVIVLLISVVLALIIIGAVGGLGLMYPTIAVEGSDTFDAFSRSYSYVYARPWRTIFYTLVSAVYGTLCFVFVKLLVGLVFSSASAILGATMNLSSAGWASPLGKLQAMWFTPTLSGPFFGRFYLFKLTWSEAVASFFIAFWVFLFVGLVIAFAISFFFSSFTLSYLLLRRCVDATELDEVYVEEFESPLAADPLTADPAPAAAPESAPSAPPASTPDTAETTPSAPQDTAGQQPPAQPNP